MGNCFRPYISLDERQVRKQSDRSNAYLPQKESIGSDMMHHKLPILNGNVMFDHPDDCITIDSPIHVSSNCFSPLSPTISNEIQIKHIQIDPSLMHISDREDSTTINETLFLKRFHKLIIGKNPLTQVISNMGDHSCIRKFSSTSSVFIDSSTVTQPNLKHTLKCVSLALHNLIVFDSRHEQPRNLDIFDERIHPVSDHNPSVLIEHLIPEPKSIYKFMKHLFHSAQLTAECAIITLIYLERLLICAEIDITVSTWKRILLGSILLASKVWDDQAVWNVDYCHILKELQVDDVNEMERAFLELLQFDINVPSSTYAKYYFDLRTFSDFNNISLPLEPMSKKKAVYLEAIAIQNDQDYDYYKYSNRCNSVERVYPSKSLVVLN